MAKTSPKGLFIFRRDLRLEDNTGLIFALKNFDVVYPIFIFTPEQIEKNTYRSDHALQFMAESLEELSEAIEAKGGKLSFFFGKPHEVVQVCIEKIGISGVVVNRDYTPYSKQRDEKISRVCREMGVSFYSFDDALLHPPESTLKKNGEPYTIFTPYYRNALHIPVPAVQSNRYQNYFGKELPFADGEALRKKLTARKIHPSRGGRKAALKILKSVEQFEDYTTLKDYPAENKTTLLSPHLKFTTCSVREVYYAISSLWGPGCELIRSLFWRDFFTSIAFHFPHVFEGPYNKKFENHPWSNDREIFELWCKGQTGFPLIDAGMRELDQTGNMANRVRMVAASLLVKDLNIDWRWGEKFFAQHLTDYDPAINNGNWQWVAGCGADAMPYFRKFNPWRQQVKFDPQCLYIKKWIPELAETPLKIIHRWDQIKNHGEYGTYPPPLEIANN